MTYTTCITFGRIHVWVMTQTSVMTHSTMMSESWLIRPWWLNPNESWLNPSHRLIPCTSCHKHLDFARLSHDSFTWASYSYKSHVGILFLDNISFVGVAHLTRCGRSCSWALYRYEPQIYISHTRAFIHKPWLNHIWAMTPSYASHDTFICEPWLLRMWAMTH